MKNVILRALSDALENNMGMMREILSGEPDLEDVKEKLAQAEKAYFWIQKGSQLEQAVDVTRKLMTTVYCIDQDTYVKIMNNGIDDAYSRGKWKKMQDDTCRWYCELDRSEAQKFMAYVLRDDF